MYNIGYITLIGGIATTAPHLSKFCTHTLTYPSLTLMAGLSLKHLIIKYMDTSKLPMYEVLFAFMSGERLTVQKAFRLFHTTELRKIVSRLRKRGYDIRAERKHKESIDGRNVMFNEYYLQNE